MNIKIANKKFELLPSLAFNYFVYSAIALFLLCFAVDSFVLTSLEDAGKICSSSWRRDNDTLLHQMMKRNLADDNNPIWRSDGFPVSVVCPKSKRIMVMGDSFVWGSGYANLNTIWWRQLQRELQRRGYNDVEVVGAGMRGAPTRKELKWAKELVPLYKPDAVIWGYVTNDPEEGMNKYGLGYVKNVQLPEDDLPVRPKILISTVFPNLGDELFSLRAGNRTTKLSGKFYGYDFADWELKLLEGKNWEVYTDTVSQLGTYVQALPIPSFAVTLPSCLFSKHNPLKKQLSDQIRDYYALRYQPVEKLFAANRIKWYDTLDTFLDLAKQDKRMESPDPPLWLGINPANGHPGPLATYAHAYKTADILERDFPSCLGKKTLPVETAEYAHINDWLPASINLKQNSQHIFFRFPDNDTDMLTMPVRKPFVQLNLETPLTASQIKLNGANLTGADVYFSSEDADRHFDDGSLTELGQKKGCSLTWNVPPSARSSHLNTIRVCAQFNGPDHGLLMDVVSAKSLK